jgi:hypothetical protein
MINTSDPELQKRISELMLNQFRLTFPAQIFELKEHADFSIDILIKRKRITLWVTTYDAEISMGFDNEAGECAWHSHMELLNAFLFEEQIETAIKILQNIFTDKTKIAIGKNNWIVINETDDIDDLGKESTYEYWSNL